MQKTLKSIEFVKSSITTITKQIKLLLIIIILTCMTQTHFYLHLIRFMQNSKSIYSTAHFHEGISRRGEMVEFHFHSKTDPVFTFLSVEMS